MAIGEILEKHFVTEMGVVLSNTDFSRVEALRDEEAEYTSWGIRSCFTEKRCFEIRRQGLGTETSWSDHGESRHFWPVTCHRQGREHQDHH